MELRIKSLAQQCALTGEAFGDGETVACHLYRDDAGELQRVDVRAAAGEGYAPPGAVLCRWQRRFKAGTDEAEERRERLASAESLFLSMEEEAASDGDAKALRYLLALMLERKRVLKAREDHVYVHAASGQAYAVEPMLVDEALAARLAEQLRELV